jgi:peptidyl-tRNA hydrolase
MAEYVLTDFNDNEMKMLDEKFDTVSTLIDEFITGGVNGLLDANSRLSNPNKDSENNHTRS